MSEEIEESNELKLDFNKLSQICDKKIAVIPVAVQNIDTKEIILIAYVNEEALNLSIKTKTAVFFSTSRNEIWIKGETSGEKFDLLEIFVNCEQNSLVYKVRPKRKNICHTKNKNGEPRNCFYRKLEFETKKLTNINP
ncbi:MAG: phosphoribosyl-AMP cyclohydrolase [Chitinivibrionia bacterium]|nr:phosphoribosyl-AMP cyclohydrolase [Chitinivibrionia bacterium]